MSLLKKSKGTFFVSLGYLLSPLSWWNDLFFNLPIAYGFAYLFNWISTHAKLITHPLAGKLKLCGSFEVGK